MRDLGTQRPADLDQHRTEVRYLAAISSSTVLARQMNMPLFQYEGR